MERMNERGRVRRKRHTKTTTKLLNLRCPDGLHCLGMGQQNGTETSDSLSQRMQFDLDVWCRKDEEPELTVTLA